MSKTLAVCMIVKNEAEHLRDALLSARNVARHTYIIDYGSVDGTIDILKELDDEPWLSWVQMSWPGRYDTARNNIFSAFNITEDHILWLDGDERLGSSMVDKVLQHTERNTNNTSFRIVQRHWTDEHGHRGMVYTKSGPGHSIGYYDTKVGRIHPNLPEIRFEGKVHEMFEYSVLRHKLPYQDADIIIDHLGKLKDPAFLMDKTLRYAELGEDKAAEVSDPYWKAKAYFEAGCAYWEAKAPQKAMHAFNNSVQAYPNFFDSWYHMGAILLQAQQWQRARSCFQQAMMANAEFWPPYHGAGQCAAAEGEWEEARGYYHKAYDLGGRAPCLLEHLGDAACNTKRYAEGARFYRHFLKCQPRTERIISKIKQATRLRSKQCKH